MSTALLAVVLALSGACPARAGADVSQKVLAAVDRDLDASARSADAVEGKLSGGTAVCRSSFSLEEAVKTVTAIGDNLPIARDLVLFYACRANASGGVAACAPLDGIAHRGTTLGAECVSEHLGGVWFKTIAAGKDSSKACRAYVSHGWEGKPEVKPEDVGKVCDAVLAHAGRVEDACAELNKPGMTVADKDWNEKECVATFLPRVAPDSAACAALRENALMSIDFRVCPGNEAYRAAVRGKGRAACGDDFWCLSLLGEGPKACDALRPAIEDEFCSGTKAGAPDWIVVEAARNALDGYIALYKTLSDLPTAPELGPRWDRFRLLKTRYDAIAAAAGLDVDPAQRKK